MRKNFYQDLLEQPGEYRKVDYKAAIALDANADFDAKFVKHILGMANAGGGLIVIGYKEVSPKSYSRSTRPQARLLRPDPKMSEEVAGSYDPTRLAQKVQHFLLEGQRVALGVKQVKYQGKRFRSAKGKVFPIIEVSPCGVVPLVCRHDYKSRDGKKILRSGAIYLRVGGAQTICVATLHQDAALDDLQRLVSVCAQHYIKAYGQVYAQGLAEEIESRITESLPSLEDLEAMIDERVSEEIEDLYPGGWD